MVENYCNSGSTRRSFRSNSERQRGFDCRPQFQQQKSSALRNSCGPSTSNAAAAVITRESYESCCCPQKTTNDCQTAKSEQMRSSLYCNSSLPSTPQQTSLPPNRYSTYNTTTKSRTSDCNSGVGILSAGIISSTPQASYSLQHGSCRPSVSSLIQDPSCSQNINTNTNTCCCCCPQCGKPQDPLQASSPPCPPPPKRTLPCRAKAQPPKEEKRTPETEFKCRMRKLQMENLVKDQYCPGAIQSTIDCDEDFNEMSFRLIFGCDPLPCTLPPVEPISLLEAFCMRVELERCLLTNEALYNQQRRGSRRGSSEIDEVDEFFSRKPNKTQLNEAVASLLKAEKWYSAENPDENTLAMDAQINKTCTCLPSSSFKITAFTGNTKPCL
ncbi:uncharacterized protein [Eurosta solidaginis]|uniref:uncharacterized protein n=1 Tax=Eurosta solidaginis TaxID=178769 RepID=UPI0035307DF3